MSGDPNGDEMRHLVDGAHGDLEVNVATSAGVPEDIFMVLLTDYTDLLELNDDLHTQRNESDQRLAGTQTFLEKVEAERDRWHGRYVGSLFLLWLLVFVVAGLVWWGKG